MMISNLGFSSVPGTSQAAVPRPPPPPPTPLDFPRCSTSLPKLPLTPESTKNFRSTYTKIKKPSDVRLEHLEGLNVAIEHDVELEDLIPVDPTDGASTLPPRSWSNLPSGCDDATIRSLQLPDKKLSTGRVRPNIQEFRQRYAELSYSNEDAFHVVQRKPPVPGKPPVKPGQYYRFWQGLDLLAQWWDTSQDDLHIDTSDAASAPTERTYIGRRVGAGKDLPEQYREDCVKGFVEVIAWEFGCRLLPPRMTPRLTVRASLFPSRFSNLAYRTPSTIAEQRSGMLEGPVLGVQCRPETSFRSPEDEVGKGQAEILDLMREVVGTLIMAQERAREGKEEKKPGAGKWWCEAPRWGGGPGGEVGNPVGNSDDPAPPIGRGRAGLRGDRRASFKRLDRQSSGAWDKKVKYQAIGKNKESGVDDIFLISSINHHISILHLRVSHSYLRFLESGALPRYPVSPSLKSSFAQAAATAAAAGAHSQDDIHMVDISGPGKEPETRKLPATVTGQQIGARSPAYNPSPPVTTPATPSSPMMMVDGSKVVGGKGNGGACALPTDWYVLRMRRSKWFNLLDVGERIEATRGLWGVFGYLMREVEAEGGEGNPG
ncbi:hypothetical protein FGG08_006866 [Glutinoglossum americanum]|uniref:Uncharacterized protein n=1 Tax=Glutinoglossum americanum TaxID=1670608 RepID=A0A9P8HRU4_9PEZI|nr:hypothetical protein FGG08_006866 [Glutinoglossum americanum]